MPQDSEGNTATAQRGVGGVHLRLRTPEGCYVVMSEGVSPAPVFTMTAEDRALALIERGQEQAFASTLRALADALDPPQEAG